MPTTAENFMPVLFKVLFGFIGINMLVTVILFYTKKMKIYKLLMAYWPMLMLVYVMQSIYQTGNLPVALAYSVNVITCSLFAMVGFVAIGRKFPVKKYILYFLPFYPLTYALAQVTTNFKIVGMPFAIATATPLVHAFIYIHIIDRNKTTRLQKLLAILFMMQAVHCINFALFRMEPGTQLWGWLVAYALYDMAAILLPAIALEESNLSENDRLQNLVNLKTAELNKSMKENDSLLKVLLHDLSSPLMTMRFYLNYVKASPETEIHIEKARKSQSAMEKIVTEIKNIYGKRIKREKINLKPVILEECFSDVELIFSDKLQRKNLKLKFTNELSPKTKVLADQTTLTHSVLSNLVSNGMKFSFPDSVIEIKAREMGDNVILEVIDSGPGMPKHVIESVMLDKNLQSTEGTMGEMGTGFGLSIVKSFVNSYGGQIEFDSKIQNTHPNEHGTSVRITLDRA